MIFGKTDTTRYREEADREKNWAMGVRKFAFFPERIYDGRFIWLRYYYSYRGILRKNVIFDADGNTTVEYSVSSHFGSTIRNYLEKDEKYIWKN